MFGHERLGAGVEVVHEHHAVVAEALAGEHLNEHVPLFLKINSKNSGSGFGPGAA